MSKNVRSVSGFRVGGFGLRVWSLGLFANFCGASRVKRLQKAPDPERITRRWEDWYLRASEHGDMRETCRDCPGPPECSTNPTVNPSMPKRPLSKPLLNYWCLQTPYARKPIPPAPPQNLNSVYCNPKIESHISAGLSTNEHTEKPPVNQGASKSCINPRNSSVL